MFQKNLIYCRAYFRAIFIRFQYFDFGATLGYIVNKTVDEGYFRGFVKIKH